MTDDDNNVDDDNDDKGLVPVELDPVQRDHPGLGPQHGGAQQQGTQQHPGLGSTSYTSYIQLITHNVHHRQVDIFSVLVLAALIPATDTPALPPCTLPCAALCS